MKYAFERWLKVVAICLGLATTAWAQAVVVPGGPHAENRADREAAVVISDDSGAVRVGESASASVTVSAPRSDVQRSEFVVPPDQVLGPAPPAFPNAVMPQNGDIGYANMSPLDQIQWRVGNTSIDQYGIQGGFTNLNAFVPIFVESDSALFFVNPRLMLTDYGQTAGSVGFGRRFYSPDEDRVYGCSFWYDVDGGHAGTYHQLGGSFESLGRYFSLRGNFSLPLGHRSTRAATIAQDPVFVGNQIVQPFIILTEQSFQSYDVEAAIPFPGLGRYGIDLGLGMYYLNAFIKGDTAGVSVRTQAQVTENFWINGIYTHDNQFRNQCSINLELTMPDGMPSKWFRRSPVSSQLMSSVLRRYRVPTNLIQGAGSTVVTTPGGDGFNIAVIDPNLAPNTPGDGSFDHPFPSVLAYENSGLENTFNLIYVLRRNDLSDTQLNTTITLLDFQTLVGDGTLSDGTRPTIDTSVGPISLPGTPGEFPKMTNSAAPGLNVITLANGNEVAGFQIGAGGTANGIFGSNIDGFNLHDLSIGEVSGVIKGILITSNTAPVLGVPQENIGTIRDTEITGQNFESNAGIDITHTDGTLDLLLRDLTITGFRGEDADGDGELALAEDNNGNGLLDRGYGIDFKATGGVVNAGSFQLQQTGFYGNTLTNNGIGMQIVADSAVMDAAVLANIFDGNQDPLNTGFIATADNGATLTLNAVVSNAFTNNVGDGVLLQALGGATLNLPTNAPGVPGFILNTITGNTAAGIRVVAAGAGSVANVSFGAVGGQNTINNNGTDAFLFQADNGGVINVGQLINNPIQGNQGAVIHVTGDGGTINLGTITGTTFDRTTTGTAGVLFDASDATISGVITNNIFLGSANNPDITFAIGGEIRGGSLDLVISDNTITDSTDAGIGFVFTESDDRPAPGTGTPLQGTAAQASLVITGNVITGTTAGLNPNFDGSGIMLVLEGQEHDTGVPPVDPTTLVQPAAMVEAFIAENLIGIDAASVPLLNNPDLTTINTALGNAGAGITIRVGGDTAITDLASVASPIDDPELTGMHIGAGIHDGRSFVGNVIVNNQLDGIQVLRTDSSIIDNFEIVGNRIQNNKEDGISLIAKNSGLAFGVEETLDFAIIDNVILNSGFLTSFVQNQDPNNDPNQGTAGRGIQLRAEGSSILAVDISGNLIDGSRMSGIEARTQTTSHLYVDPSVPPTFRDSLIDATGGSEAVIYGAWTENVITNNGFIFNEDLNGNGVLDPGEDTNANAQLDLIRQGHGIALGRIDFVDPDNPALIIEGFNDGGLVVNGLPPELTIQNNVISGNSWDGIHMFFDKARVFSVAAAEPRTQRINVLNNNISGNGDDGLDINNPIAGAAIINFNNNVVTGNGVYSGVDTFTEDGGNTVAITGDGIQIISANGGQLTFNAAQNRIKENVGRGVNVFTAFGGYNFLNFTENNISSNKLEGFYLVNAPLNSIPVGRPALGAPDDVTVINPGYGTAGTITSWFPDMKSNHELFGYGHAFPDPDPNAPIWNAGNAVPAKIAPFIPAYEFVDPGGIIGLQFDNTDLIFINNIVDNNGGVAQDPDPSGDTTSGFFDPYTTVGGFVIRIGTSSVDEASQFDPPFFRSVPDPNTGVGGVRALVTGNRMAGNVGSDVFFDGFVATAPPNVSILPDPLIRFDLVFENNRGVSLDVSGENFTVFYTNTAPTLPGADPADVKRTPPPDGPFVAAGAPYPRDATRNLGFFNGLGPFPGFGEPTLRIEEDGAAFTNGAFIGNNLFNVIYSDFFPDTGTPLTGEWLHWPDGTLLPIPPFPIY